MTSEEREIGVWIICIVFGGLAILTLIVNAIASHIAWKREAKEMIEKGYEWTFIISCSADPGSWGWAKRK